MKTKTFENLLSYLVLGASSIVAIFPFCWMVVTSFKQPIDVITQPPKFIFDPTLMNYIAVVTTGGWSAQGNFMLKVANSIEASLAAVLVSIASGTPAAYAIARINFPYKDNIYFTYVTFRFLPPFVAIIPLFIMYGYLKLYDSLVGLTLAYILISLPLTVWMMVPFFEQIPKDIEEAATIDGCSGISLFYRILLPLIKPGIAATMALNFIFCWNDFIFGLILTFQQAQPVQYAMSLFVSYAVVHWGQMAAAGVICAIPILVFFVFVQKYIIRGLTFGAVKG